MIKYLLVGLLNTAVGLSIIYSCMYWLWISPVMANMVGYSFGIVLSYGLNRRWTFDSDVGIVKGFLRFLIVVSIAYLSNVYSLIALIDYLHVDPYLAQPVGVIPYTIIGYLGSKYLVFGVVAKDNKNTELSDIKHDVVIKGPVKIAIVVPCYNEEAVLPHTTDELQRLFDKLMQNELIRSDSEICFVDDGSSDHTWNIIEGLSKQWSYMKGIKLSHNCGHQNALLAGLFNTDSEATISIDADLQDDLAVISVMIEKYKLGHEVVYGIRSNRQTDGFFKRFTAELYYRILQSMGVEIVFNHADFRLLGKNAVQALKAYKEVNLFLRGIVPKLGYRQAYVYYSRAERYAGESKYPLAKMLALAWDGITSFSNVPLRLITVLGLMVSSFSFFILLWAFYISVFTDKAIPGWASTVLPIYFLGGVQLLSLGIIAEYVGKVFLEAKQRPRYIIEKKL